MSSLPATMAKAARAGATLLRRGLPEEIVIWEILVRLPPKSLLRCRAVCRAWHRVTSTRHFLLAHHAHQPSLPLVHGFEYGNSNYQDILAFDHRAAAAQLQPVARLDDRTFDLEASCGGLLVLSIAGLYFICNPATRQYARLPLLCGFTLLGMYPHRPTGEYRLLLLQGQKPVYEDPIPGGQDACYVFALGSNQPPRYIGLQDAEAARFSASVLVRDSLHWYPMEHQSGSKMIMVFDTTSESFRQMHAPDLHGNGDLFEMDGMLGMYSCNDAVTIIDIWMQDYQSEVWAFKYRVELPVAEIKVQLGKFGIHGNVVVTPGDGDVLVLVEVDEWLIQVDMDGKLVASLHRGDQCLVTSQLRLKQTLVPHTFFPTLDGYVVNASPFI